MGHPGKKLNKQDILDAIKLKKGYISEAAALLDCERQTIYSWMDRDEDVRKAVEEERGNELKERLDAERRIVAKAYKTIEKLVDEDKDVTATIFTLKTKAGWREKQDQQNQTKIVIKDPLDE